MGRAEELAKSGFKAPKIVTDLVDAINQARETGEPLTYGRLRDFQTAASSLSQEETAAIKGPMGRQIRDLAQALKQGNREIMDKIGLGNVFDQAMKEYARGATIRGAEDIAKRFIIRHALDVVLGGAGAGGAYALYKHFFD